MRALISRSAATDLIWLSLQQETHTWRKPLCDYSSVWQWRWRERDRERERERGRFLGLQIDNTLKNTSITRFSEADARYKITSDERKQKWFQASAPSDKAHKKQNQNERKRWSFLCLLFLYYIYIFIYIICFYIYILYLYLIWQCFDGCAERREM